MKMKNVSESIYNTTSRVADSALSVVKGSMPLCIGLGVALASGNAMALLPDDPGGLLPDSIGADTDGFSAGAALFEMGLKIGAVGVGALMAIGGPYKMYNTYVDKKAQEDASNLGSMVFMGLLVIALGVTLAVGGYNWADGMAAAITGGA